MENVLVPNFFPRPSGFNCVNLTFQISFPCLSPGLSCRLPLHLLMVGPRLQGQTGVLSSGGNWAVTFSSQKPYLFYTSWDAVPGLLRGNLGSRILPVSSPGMNRGILCWPREAGLTRGPFWGGSEGDRLEERGTSPPWPNFMFWINTLR